MDKNRKKLMSAFMIMLVIAALAVAGYYIINKQITQKAQDEVNLPDTEVGKLLAKDRSCKTLLEIKSVYVQRKHG